MCKFTQKAHEKRDYNEDSTRYCSEINAVER
jgi:hypothetical protein